MAHLAWHLLHILCIVVFIGLIPAGILPFSYIVNRGHTDDKTRPILYWLWVNFGLVCQLPLL